MEEGLFVTSLIGAVGGLFGLLVWYVKEDKKNSKGTIDNLIKELEATRDINKKNLRQNKEDCDKQNLIKDARIKELIELAKERLNHQLDKQDRSIRYNIAGQGEHGKILTDIDKVRAKVVEIDRAAKELLQFIKNKTNKVPNPVSAKKTS